MSKSRTSEIGIAPVHAGAGPARAGAMDADVAQAGGQAGVGSSGAAVGGPVPPDYESAVAELESLVERMEDGRLALEDSLSAYQRGVDLVRYCREQLAAVEQKVRVLEAGLLQPFESGITGGDLDDRDDS